MSELANLNLKGKTFRLALLASVSSLALLTAALETDNATAAEDRPTVWVELGGQMEQMQGITNPFSAPFMQISPTPGPYSDDIFNRGQKITKFGLGLEGALSFQPENSDWVFSASVRYSRLNSKHLLHQQSAVPSIPGYLPLQHRPIGMFNLHGAAYAEVHSSSAASDTILDFSVGRDVGIGVLGRSGKSTVNLGVRIAQFSSRASDLIYARPDIGYVMVGRVVQVPQATFYDYAQSGIAHRNFHGVGPSLSWNSSTALFGNTEDAELTLDLGLNAAVLFGRQKAEVTHSTQKHYFGFNVPANHAFYTERYSHQYQTNRSRAVTVPNVGGTIGFSVKYPNAKISLGYRADFFFGATDTGIDVRRTSDLGFRGPFASISIGLGG